MFTVELNSTKYTSQTLKGQVMKMKNYTVSENEAMEMVSVLITNDYNLTDNLLYGLAGSAIAAGIAAVMNLENNIKSEDDENVSNF